MQQDSLHVVSMPYHDIIIQLISAKNGTGHSWTFDVDFLSKLKKEFSSKHKLKDIPSNIQLIKAYREMKKTYHLDCHTSFAMTSDSGECLELTKEDEKKLLNLLKKRGIRSQSGIVSVQVLTKPWPCPGTCIFCPSEKGMPKSYISSEPGAMRAALNKFDPIKQVYNRLRSLSITGHETDKIELIVLGGTFDCYTKDYKIAFVKALYDACNTFSKLKIKDGGNSPSKVLQPLVQQRYRFEIGNLKTITYSKTLAEAMKKNETAKHRIIWLTIETRPEFVTDQHCMFWRELGVTRIEMWVQSLDDEVLKANKRGNTVEQIRNAFDVMRRWGFKISVHIMPWLYMSSYAKDLKTFVDLYKDPFLKPDEIKFYPTSVIPHTKLAQLYKKGEYVPLETADIKKLIRQTFLEVIPPYTRIKRLIRDIPANEIMAGSKITNLGQLMHREMEDEMKKWNSEKLEKFYGRLYPNVKIVKNVKNVKNVNDVKDVKDEQSLQTFIVWWKPDIKTFRNFVCLDTRSREVRHALDAGKRELLVIRKYASSVWTEYFISYEDQLWYLYGFTRLLLPCSSTSKELQPLVHTDVWMIRELHVYGDAERVTVNGKRWESVQHTWFGRRLMEVAEELAKQNGFKKIAVISGVGVRGYYRKLGYKLQNTYMVKWFT